MKKTKFTMERQLNLKEISQEFISQVAECSEEFKECKEKYDNALEMLREGLGESASPTVEELADALDMQLAISVLYSWRLGYEANLDHFRNPVNRTFIEVDSEVYLRETTLHNLRQYEETETTVDKFFSQLDDNQRNIYEAVFEFTAFTATVIPKLAHFLGYSYADTVLPLIEPGYTPDHILTDLYKLYLNEMDTLFAVFLEGSHVDLIKE